MEVSRRNPLLAVHIAFLGTLYYWFVWLLRGWSLFSSEFVAVALRPPVPSPAFLVCADHAWETCPRLPAGWLRNRHQPRRTRTSRALSFATHHFFFLGWTFGMQLRISTTTILYDKILRLRLSSLGQVRHLHFGLIETACTPRVSSGAIVLSFLRGGSRHSAQLEFRSDRKNVPRERSGSGRAV